MLLSVMALAESGQLAEHKIRYTPELLEIFARFFEIVRAGNDRCTPYNPFFYLKRCSFGFGPINPIERHGTSISGDWEAVLPMRSARKSRPYAG
jgi:hypothetical protein